MGEADPSLAVGEEFKPGLFRLATTAYDFNAFEEDDLEGDIDDPLSFQPSPALQARLAQPKLLVRVQLPHDLGHITLSSRQFPSVGRIKRALSEKLMRQGRFFI